MKSDHASKGLRVSLVSIIFSILLAIIKLISGVVGKSTALVSDGVNSFSDIFSYSIVAGGVVAADRRPDSNHQYGHDKLESIIGAFLAIIILFTGLGIGYNAIKHLIKVDVVVIPTMFPLIVAAISIVVKLILWRYTARNAVKTGLSSLKALAADHLSDMLSSLGALIGVIGSRLGYLLSDPVASLVIALLIIKSALDAFKVSYNILMDVAVDNKTKEALTKSILKDSEVKQVDLLRTRSVGSGYWVEVEISCKGDLTLTEAHQIAENLHDRLEKEFPKIRHVMIHTNPYME